MNLIQRRGGKFSLYVAIRWELMFCLSTQPVAHNSANIRSTESVPPSRKTFEMVLLRVIPFEHARLRVHYASSC